MPLAHIGSDGERLFFGQLAEPLPTVPRLQRSREIASYFRGRLENREVLDLGCGAQAAGYRIANHSGASRYTGVELYCAKTAHDRIFDVQGDCHSAVVQQDIFAFLEEAALRKQSYDCVFAVGLDEWIIPPPRWGLFAKLISRCVADEGYVVVFEMDRVLLHEFGRFFEPDPEFVAVADAAAAKDGWPPDRNPEDALTARGRVVLFAGCVVLRRSASGSLCGMRVV